MARGELQQAEGRRAFSARWSHATIEGKIQTSCYGDDPFDRGGTICVAIGSLLYLLRTLEAEITATQMEKTTQAPSNVSELMGFVFSWPSIPSVSSTC